MGLLKYLIIVFAAVALYSFTLPLVEVDAHIPHRGTQHRVQLTLTGADLIRGSAALAPALGQARELAISSGDVEAERVVRALEKTGRWTGYLAVIPFLPGVLLLLLGLLAGIGRLGRITGALVACVAAAGVLGWALMQALAEERGAAAWLGSGLDVMAIAYAAALAVGALAVLLPERL